MSNSPERQAVVDVGSSSIKLAVYDLSTTPPTVLREPNPVPTRLGRGLRPGGELAPAAREATLDAVRRFRGEAEAEGATIRLVLATEAVRLAADRERFLPQLAEASGCDDVRCITAEEEARFAWRAMTRTLGPFDTPVLCYDPGGSSNDFGLGAGDEPDVTLSLPFGMNHLTAVHAPSVDEGRCDAAACERLRTEIRERFVALRAWLDDHPTPGRLVANSGAVIAMAAVLHGLQEEGRLFRARRTHGSSIDSAGIARLLEGTAELTSRARRERYPCLTEARAAIFVHGLLVYEALLEVTGLPEVTVNGYGLTLGAIV